MQGRPSKYTEELAATICSRIAEGESVRSICRDKDMPATSTVFLWMSKEEGFSEQYARAKDESAEHWAEEIVSIADDDTGDVQRDRLRIDSRKWIASKLKPKKYGDKLDVDHTGTVNVSIVKFGDNIPTE